MEVARVTVGGNWRVWVIVWEWNARRSDGNANKIWPLKRNDNKFHHNVYICRKSIVQMAARQINTKFIFIESHIQCRRGDMQYNTEFPEPQSNITTKRLLPSAMLLAHSSNNNNDNTSNSSKNNDKESAKQHNQINKNDAMNEWMWILCSVYNTHKSKIHSCTIQTLYKNTHKNKLRLLVKCDFGRLKRQSSLSSSSICVTLVAVPRPTLANFRPIFPSLSLSFSVSIRTII